MAYLTPHHARDYLKAACLSVCHDYVLRCQRRATKDKVALITSTREIDLCARVASFFGPVAHLAAQGTSDIDIQIDGPTIRAEVKYFMSPARAWSNYRNDWDWLLATSNNGNEFEKRAWILFLPSIELRAFTSCVTVSKSHGTAFSLDDFAPFSPFVEATSTPSGTNQQLRYKPVATVSRDTILQVPGGKRVLVELVSSQTHPLWAAIYTRVSAVPTPTTLPIYKVTNAPIVL
jgi:hypothetical protein